MRREAHLCGVCPWPGLANQTLSLSLSLGTKMTLNQEFHGEGLIPGPGAWMGAPLLVNDGSQRGVRRGSLPSQQ